MTDQTTTIPNGWNMTTLGENCIKIGSGATPRGGSDAYESEGISLIRSQNVHDFQFEYSGLAFINSNQADELANVEVKSSDILLNITGDSVARICIVPDKVLPARVNQHVCIIRTDEKNLHSKYLYYYLLNPTYKNYLLGLANTGATRNALTKGMVESLPIAAPEKLSEQRAIAAVLSSLDDKIELLREQNKTLESVAQTLFKEWFINFNFPGENGKPYKSSGGKMIDSELGEIPEGWSAGRLSEFVEVDPKEKVSKNLTYLFFDMKCLSTDSMEVSEGEYRRVSSGSIFIEQDTLLAKITPCLENGKTGFVFDIQGESIARGSTEFIVMRSREGMSPYFVYCLARSDSFREYAIKSMNGTSGRQRVQVEQIKKYILMINESVLNSFDSTVKPIFEKIRVNSSQVEALTLIREQLLPKLMKGLIRVTNS
jgi:type I restriction enzyme S subunit